jgi:hypothetical protein
MRRFLWEAGFWVLASLLMLGVGCLFHFVLVPVLAPGLKEEYENRALFRSLAGWPGIYMIAHPLVYGLLFAAAFRLVGGVERSPTWGRGLLVGSCFGAAVFLVGSLPVYLLNYASFAVPPGVILSWVAQSVCQYVVAGAGLGWYSGRAP